MATVGEPLLFLVIAAALVQFDETNAQPEGFFGTGRDVVANRDSDHCGV